MSLPTVLLVLGFALAFLPWAVLSRLRKPGTSKAHELGLLTLGVSAALGALGCLWQAVIAPPLGLAASPSAVIRLVAWDGICIAVGAALIAAAPALTRLRRERGYRRACRDLEPLWSALNAVTSSKLPSGRGRARTAREEALRKVIDIRVILTGLRPLRNELDGRQAALRPSHEGMGVVIVGEAISISHALSLLGNEPLRIDPSASRAAVGYELGLNPELLQHEMERLCALSRAFAQLPPAELHVDRLRPSMHAPGRQ